MSGRLRCSIIRWAVAIFAASVPWAWFAGDARGQDAEAAPPRDPIRWDLLESAVASGRVEPAVVAAGAVAFTAGLFGELGTEIRALRWLFDRAVDRRDAGLAESVGSRLSPILERLGEAADALRIRTDVGSVLVDAGELANGELWLSDVIADERSPGDPAVLSTALQSRAMGRVAAGQLARAVADAERSVEVAAGLDPASALAARSTLLSVLVATGDADRSVSLAKALIAESPVGSAEHADAMGNLGFMLYAALGRPEEAIESLVAALAELRERSDEVLVALALIHLGHARLALGQLPVRELQELDGLTLPPSQAVLVVHREVLRGDVALRSTPPKASQALSAFDTALDLATESGSSYLRFEALRGRAAALTALGRRADGLAEARRAIDVVELAAIGQPDDAAGLARAHHHSIFDLALQWAVESGDPEIVHEFIERSRARSLLDGLVSRGAAFGEALPPGLAERERVARRAVCDADRDHRIACGSGDRARSKAASARLEQAHVAYKAATEAIERDARIAAPGGSRPVAGLRDFQRRLAPFEVYVAFVTSTSPMAALVVRRRSARVVLFDHGRRAVDALDALNFDAVDDSWRAPIDVLRRELAAPLRLSVYDRVVQLNPDAGLARTPWALVFGMPESPFPRSLAVVPSAAVLGWIRERPRESGRGTLAVGDPDYRVSRDPRDTLLYGLKSATALPGTAEEVRALVRTADDVLLLGAEATEHRVREVTSARRRWQLVYFAGHGHWNSLRPERSCLYLSPEPPDDGFLSAHEVGRMAMPADLVVLAACESGLGTDRRGEGAFGLPRAFLRAGATSVVGSLWKVDDDATRALLSSLLARRRDGVCLAVAMAEAQASIARLRHWSHPKYWAGWQVVGGGA